MVDAVLDLRDEAHVQHSVRLVQHQELNFGEGDSSSLHEVEESARSGGQDVASLTQGMALILDTGSSVHVAAAQISSAGELPGLVVDLDHQLSGGRHDHHLWSSSEPVDILATWSDPGQLVNHGEEKCSSFTRASLSSGHEVSTLLDDGDSILLNWGGLLVLGSPDVAHQKATEVCLIKGLHGSGFVLALNCDRNLVVLGEVDPGARVVLPQLPQIPVPPGVVGLDHHWLP